MKPEADEEIACEAHQLPAHEEQQQVVRDDEAEHRGGEERQETEEPREVLVVAHVADAEDEDERADEGVVRERGLYNLGALERSAEAPGHDRGPVGGPANSGPRRMGG